MGSPIESEGDQAGPSVAAVLFLAWDPVEVPIHFDIGAVLEIEHGLIAGLHFRTNRLPRTTVGCRVLVSGIRASHIDAFAFWGSENEEAKAK